MGNRKAIATKSATPDRRKRHLRKIPRALMKDVKERDGLEDLTECFIDGSFVIAKKETARWEKLSGGNVQSSLLRREAKVVLVARSGYLDLDSTCGITRRRQPLG